MKTVFIVSMLGGEWEDSWEHPVKVVCTEERAQKLVKELEDAEEKRRVEDAEFIEKWIDTECLEDQPFLWTDDEGVEHTGVDCSDKCNKCDADRRKWRDWEGYRYEAVPMELDKAQDTA